VTAEGATPEALARAAGADVITFTSPSTVHRYLALSGGKVPAVVACIGPVTAEAARTAGLVVDVVAAEHNAPGLVADLVHHWETRPS
jgi:uroporphyrinogen III methyltransferase/synthase